MFGHGPLFGDIVDLIRATGGRLKSVIQNIPEEVRAGTKPLARLIDEQERRWPDELRIDVAPLENFQPVAGEKCVIGFRGHRLTPLRNHLRVRFGLTFPALIHPTAIISPTAEVGEGTIVGAGAIVGSGVRLGRFALLNRGCTVGHDCSLEDFANVGPGANLASFVTLRQSATVGIGATIINFLEVGAHSVVGAGAVVTKDVPEHTLVAGVPATPKKLLNLEPGLEQLD